MTYGEFYKVVCYNCIKMLMTDRLNEVIKEEGYNVNVKDLFEYEPIQYILKNSTETMIKDNKELLNSLIENVSESLDKTLIEMYNIVFNKEEENVY